MIVRSDGLAFLSLSTNGPVMPNDPEYSEAETLRRAKAAA